MKGGAVLANISPTLLDANCNNEVIICDIWDFMGLNVVRTKRGARNAGTDVLPFRALKRSLPLNMKKPRNKNETRLRSE